MSPPARQDEIAESDSGQWAYIGKMPPNARKLTATSGPSKSAGGATTRPSTATATPGAASSTTPGPLPTPPSGATPQVKPTPKYSFLHRQPTHTPPPVQTPVPAATVTPMDLSNAMAVDDDSTPAPHRSQLTAFLHKKPVVTPELTPVVTDPESEGCTVPAVASDTQQPTPNRDSPSGMVEATKVRAMMEKSDEHPGPALPPTQEGFKLSPQDVTILRGYMDEFEQADAQMRNKILEKAVGEVYRRQPDNSQFNKKEAKQKIRKWYYNHYSPPHRPVINFVRRWSARNVFYHEDKVAIMKLTEDMSGAAPGTQDFLASIQDATTELWKKLSVEEQERFAQTAQEWSDHGPPKGIQAKMASAAIRGRIVRDFQTQLYRTCGARSIVLLAYENEDGTPQVSMDEWNADVGGGLDFNDFCPKWRESVLWDKWKKYGRKCFEKGPS
ncbi:hypothetical protein EDB86DRAFT_3086113 [Lactarius hatsudake]|nr:hypothetical protein EDB86DRAFT_3086113 [Lactarius hatsudake]